MKEQLLRQAVKDINDLGLNTPKETEDRRNNNYNFNLDDDKDREEFVSRVVKRYNHLERVELAKEGN